MRKVLIAGNWKMHKTAAEAEALATAIRDSIATPSAVSSSARPTRG